MRTGDLVHAYACCWLVERTLGELAPRAVWDLCTPLSYEESVYTYAQALREAGPLGSGGAHTHQGTLRIPADTWCSHHGDLTITGDLNFEWDSNLVVTGNLHVAGVINGCLDFHDTRIMVGGSISCAGLAVACQALVLAARVTAREFVYLGQPAFFFAEHAVLLTQEISTAILIELVPPPATAALVHAQWRLTAVAEDQQLMDLLPWPQLGAVLAAMAPGFATDVGQLETLLQLVEYLGEATSGGYLRS